MTLSTSSLLRVGVIGCGFIGRRHGDAIRSSGLGDVVARGGLVRPEARDADFTEFNRLLGIE